MRRLLLLGVTFLLAPAGGCKSGPTPIEARASATAKLAQVGLEVVSDDAAGMPPAERLRWIPCRVVPGFPRPPVPDHVDGYLITNIDRSTGLTRRDMESKIAAWKEGDRLIFTIVRNPYLAAEPGWYEVNVPVKLPAPPGS
jgi:hypothetical protein